MDIAEEVEVRPAQKALFNAINSFRFNQESIKRIPKRAVIVKPIYDDYKKDDYLINEYLFEKESIFDKISSKMNYISRAVRMLPMKLIKTKSMKTTMAAFQRAKNADIFKHKSENEIWVNETINLLIKIDKNIQNSSEEKILRVMDLVEKYESRIDSYLAEEDRVEIKQLMYSIHFKSCAQLKNIRGYQKTIQRAS